MSGGGEGRDGRHGDAAGRAGSGREPGATGARRDSADATFGQHAGDTGAARHARDREGADPGHDPDTPAAGETSRPPAWLAALPDSVRDRRPEWFADFAPPPDPARSSAVLVLVGPGEHIPAAGAPAYDVVLTERAHTLRSHAAQVAFPGGHVDPGDTGVVDAALREAAEEVGLRRESVQVVGTLPAVYMRPSHTAVTPVLAWWAAPHPIGVVDAGEVARVVRAPLADLVDPAQRFSVTAPRGYRGPGFAVAGLFVWGFTATLLDVVLDHSGLAPEWDRDALRPLPDHMLRAYRR